MGLLRRIAKKISRRVRRKGVLAAEMNRAGRNRQPMNAADLWRRVYRFKETPAAKAGTARRIRREAALAKSKQRGMFGWRL